MHNAQYDQIEALIEISRMQRAVGVVVVVANSKGNNK